MRFHGAPVITITAAWARSIPLPHRTARGKQRNGCSHTHIARTLLRHAPAQDPVRIARLRAPIHEALTQRHLPGVRGSPRQAGVSVGRAGGRRRSQRRRSVASTGSASSAQVRSAAPSRIERDGLEAPRLGLPRRPRPDLRAEARDPAAVHADSPAIRVEPFDGDDVTPDCERRARGVHGRIPDAPSPSGSRVRGARPSPPRPGAPEVGLGSGRRREGVDAPGSRRVRTRGCRGCDRCATPAARSSCEHVP